MEPARGLQEGMRTRARTRTVRPLARRIRWGNVARLAALLAAIPLAAAVLMSGHPAKRPGPRPAAPPARSARAAPPRAPTPRRAVTPLGPGRAKARRPAARRR